VNRILEAGAAGIQLSSVRKTNEVRELSAALRYAPGGSRSISLSHPQARFGAQALPDYLQASLAEPPLLVAQIETAKTDDPLDQILGAGVDVAFVGMTDLSVEVGLDQTRARARAEEVAAAAEHAGIPLGGFGLDDDRVRYHIASSDLALLRGAMSSAG
jgi:4-hydroxy-2-oxoheptanedioate aldolase